VARLISEIAHTKTGIDIHPGATIGSSFFVDHGTGVVIGETAIIGERVRVYQAVTLGARHFPTDHEGKVIKGAARHPVVEDDVIIYAGATILGRVVMVDCTYVLRNRTPRRAKASMFGVFSRG
jgi:serine O-acetyltransferase